MSRLASEPEKMPGASWPVREGVFDLGDLPVSVYAGIGVRRKRSRVAVIDEGGKVLVNRNVSNGVRPDPR